ncbi:MAG: TetR/AcrR family transcriptional regulator [Pseudomonadota bacterium]
MEEREENILDAAHAVFAENGFDGAKMAAIARHADVAEGTVYLYFKNKNALLEAVIARFYARLTEGAQRGVTGTDGTFERLNFLARYHVEQCMAEWHILELMIGLYRRMQDYEDRGYTFNKAYVAVFDQVFREGVARGELRGEVPLSIARDAFYGALEYSVRTMMLRGGGKTRARRAASRAIDLFCHGVSAHNAQAEVSGDIEAVTRRLEAVARKLEKRR